MKKLVIVMLLFGIAATATAQKLSYGIVLGGNIYNDQRSDSDNPEEIYFDSGNDDFIIPNIGAYAEYQLTTNMGLKVEATYHTKTMEKGINHSDLDGLYKLSYIDINPNFKYDFGAEYRKGFYMLLGPRIGILTGAEVEGTDVTSDFERVHMALDLGIGQRIFQFLELEMRFDYGLTPFYRDANSKCKFAGAYVSLNVDVEKIVSKIRR